MVSSTTAEGTPAGPSRSTGLTGNGPTASGLLFSDGHGEWQTIPAEVESLRRLASDSNVPLDERLEAFEDVVDSEIGDTQLARARNVEREVGFRQLYLKFEGGNPTGTQKDRIAFAQAMDTLRRGFDTICLATCGDSGAAAAVAAELAGLRCVIFIPETYQTKRIEEIRRYGAQLRRLPGDYETAVIHSRECAEREQWYDANLGGAKVALQLRAYGEIAYEIYDELRDALAAVAVPISHGTSLASIHKGFLSLYRATAGIRTRRRWHA